MKGIISFFFFSNLGTKREGEGFPFFCITSKWGVGEGNLRTERNLAIVRWSDRVKWSTPRRNRKTWSINCSLNWIG